MAQRKQVSWVQLRVGLLVVVSFTIFGLMVFLMTGQGFFSPKTDLRVFIDNAGGLKKGDPVRLSGIDIGNVDDIRVSSDPNPARAVEVLFHVENRMMKQVRQDSVAALEVEGLLGQRFIDITRGSPGKEELAAGSEVRYKVQPDFGHLMASGDNVLTNVNRLANTLNEMAADVQKGRGTLGKMMYDDTLYKQASSTVKELQDMVAYANSGKGSLGKIVYSDDVYNRIDSTATKLNTIVDDVQAQKGSLGKFIYDSSMHEDARKVINDLGEMVADTKAGKGSFGKFLTDDTLYAKATSAMTRFDDITGRLDRGEGTLGKLLAKDDPLHGNINALSLELRELLADFRKEPKKYMTIQLKLF
jgi:phospholipid/cholesterol/gamma-HCH transport system substrate-binding protein